MQGSRDRRGPVCWQRNASRARARIGHMSGLIRRRWGFAKVRLQGLSRRAPRAFAVLGLANFCLARRCPVLDGMRASAVRRSAHEARSICARDQEPRLAAVARPGRAFHARAGSRPDATNGDCCNPRVPRARGIKQSVQTSLENITARSTRARDQGLPRARAALVITRVPRARGIKGCQFGPESGHCLLVLPCATPVVRTNHWLDGIGGFFGGLGLRDLRRASRRAGRAADPAARPCPFLTPFPA